MCQLGEGRAPHQVCKVQGPMCLAGICQPCLQRVTKADLETQDRGGKEVAHKVAEAVYVCVPVCRFLSSMYYSP